MEFSIEKFSPTAAELANLAEEAKLLPLPDPFDKVQYAIVKDANSNLVHVRNDIGKTGKKAREDAIAYQKAVIEKEKELIGIIKPAEDRLAALLDEADRIIEREARIDLLPARRTKLEAIGDGIEINDGELLDMDGPTFEGYCNMRFANKLQADREALEARSAAIREEEARQQREKEMREREQKAREEERERLEREQTAKAEREAHEKQEAEARAKKEKERLEKEGRYQAFLNDHGYTEGTKDTFHIERVSEDVRLYKLVGILTIK